MNVDALERYYKIRWLEFEAKRWRPEDRLRAGTILRNDFFKAGFELKTLDPSKPRVDCMGFKEPSEKRERAENRFRQAVRAIPREFWCAVQTVCLENKTYAGERSLTNVFKADLCRGLDYLCEFYTKKERR